MPQIIFYQRYLTTKLNTLKLHNFQITIISSRPPLFYSGIQTILLNSVVTQISNILKDACFAAK